MKSTKLYHGSKSGIIGGIKPQSRPNCDFGQGFYMGTKPMQAKTLVCNKKSPMFYTVNFHLENIPNSKILRLSGMEWAFYVLYSRGRLEDVKNTNFYKKLEAIEHDKDVIIGSIADDNMNVIMDQFIKEEITDRTLLECIRCIDYGIQYVAKTENACRQIEIISEEKIDMSKHDKYQRYASDRRRESEQKIKAIKRQYRGKGKYLDQILDEYKQPEIIATPNKLQQSKLF